jgi:hypothetical protein
LLQLGDGRRELGQKERIWTEDKNRVFLSKVDLNNDGVIGECEFVEYFEAALPEERELFDMVIVEFMLVAGACRAQLSLESAIMTIPSARESRSTTPVIPPLQLDLLQQCAAADTFCLFFQNPDLQAPLVRNLPIRTRPRHLTAPVCV